jgi:molybdate transport system substrate-binding protein
MTSVLHRWFNRRFLAFALVFVAQLPFAWAGVAEGERKAEVCVACHGVAGRSSQPDIPILAGQQAQFIATQLYLFREGRRVNPAMNAIAGNLTNADLKDLSAYFASQSPGKTEAKISAELKEKGQQLAASYHCNVCHTPQFKGQQHIPRLAGQHAQYLKVQLTHYKNSTRADMDGQMTSSSQVLQPGDIDILADYIAAYQDPEIVVVSSGGFAEAYKELAPEFEKKTGHHLVSNWGPSMGNTRNAIPARLARNETIDVVIMVGGALDDLMQQGQLLPGSKQVLANSPIACAVKQGSAKPDIGTVEKLRNTFLNAKSVAFSDSASGEYIKNKLMDQLGIKEQMKDKARQIPATPVGEIVAKGEAEFGCQQRSELMAVKGIDIVGLLPAEVQLVTPFSAAVVASSRFPKESMELVKFLSAAENAHVIEATGLEPIAGKH